jgi:hypothetical protein
MSKWLLSAFTVCLTLLSSGVQAGAPQVLALVETLDPVRLTCMGETCQAELSTFCLQQERRAPLHGTPYRLTGKGGLDLLVTTPSGEVRHLAAGKYVRLTSVRGFTAVTATIPRQVLDHLGGEQASLAVGTAVSLLPSGPTVASDIEDDDDTKLATGPFRGVGRRLVEGSGAAIQSVRATNALINFFPKLDDHSAVASREDLWRIAVTDRMRSVDPAELEPARQALDDCAASFRSLAGEGMRRCLQIRHDTMLEKLTHKYWQAVGAGS